MTAVFVACGGRCLGGTSAVKESAVECRVTIVDSDDVSDTEEVCYCFVCLMRVLVDRGGGRTTRDGGCLVVINKQPWSAVLTQ